MSTVMARISLLLLFFIALLTLVTVAVGQGLSPTQEMIFLALQDDREEIYTFDMLRGIRHRIFRNGDFQNREMLAWSPDGRQIVFASNMEIYVMDMDGRNLRNVSNHPAIDWFPSWSPDGMRIAFVSHRDGNQEIYIIDLKSGALSNLSQHPANDSLPAWSPNGTLIAFQSQRSEPYGLFVMDNSGQNARRLADYCGNIAPLWNTDGEQLVYVSYCNGNGDIFSAHVTKRSVRRLTLNRNDDVWPAWSPDYQYIAFVTTRNRNREIYSMQTSGDRVERLTFHQAMDTTPAWSPDGKHIAFVSVRDGKRSIYVMNTDGENLKRLTFMDNENYLPIWRPLPQ